MRSRWVAICVTGLCWVRLASADTILLRNGDRVEGQIVEETASNVSIRRALKGNVKFVDKINRNDIALVTRSETQPAESDASAASQPATEPELSAAKILDKPAFLEAAIKKFQKPDYNAAGMDLSRLINNSSAAELAKLGPIVQDKLTMDLAELAATAHFRAAMEKAKGRAVRFQYVTELEKPKLIPLIVEAYDKAIDFVIAAPADAEKPDAQEARADDRTRSREGDAALDDNRANTGSRRQDSHRRSRNNQRSAARTNRDRQPDREIPGGDREANAQPTSRPAMCARAWMEHPEHFDGNRHECAAMAVQIYHAKSLLGERLRLDPQVRTDVDLKAQLAVDRNRLDALLKAVNARNGGALTPAEREAREAEIQNRYDAMWREEHRRRREAWDAMNETERLIEEQRRQNQQGPPPDPRLLPPPQPQPQPEESPSQKS